jgi:hypothetical protein
VAEQNFLVRFLWNRALKHQLGRLHEYEKPDESYDEKVSERAHPIGVSVDRWRMKEGRGNNVVG